MKNKFLLLFSLLLLSFIFLKPALAHQPNYIADTSEVLISDPEISRAYYGELVGSPVVFTMKSESSFDLYVGLLAPDIANTRQDFLVEIADERGNQLASLNGIYSPWERWYERFAGDWYWEGPEFKKVVEPGTYFITVSGSDNLGKYVLATGEIESFPVSESVNTLREIYRVKKNFFELNFFAMFSGKIGRFVLASFFFFVSLVLILIFVILKKKFLFKRKSFKLKHKKFFTLLEILLVVAAIGILASIVIVAINPGRQLAQIRNTQRRSDIKSISDSINQYLIDNKEIPPGIDDVLRVLGKSGAGCDISCGEKIAVLEQPFNNLTRRIDNFIEKNIPLAKADAPTGWVLPTSYSDPGNQWSNEANSYDGNTGTYAQNTYGGVGWGQFIILNLASPVTSDRIRINADYLDAQIAEVDVDVYKDGAWENVFQGGSESIWNCKWVELSFPKGQVSQVRFRYNYSSGGYYYWLYEVQVYQTVDVITPPICSSQAATSIQKSAAIIHGLVADDGGEPNEYRFEYGLNGSYGQSTSWTGGKLTGDVFSELISGLNAYTTYHFKAQIRNSAGIGDCPDNTFTTRLVDTGWVLPLSYNDPDNAWESESEAYDDTFSTYARSYHYYNASAWSSFIYFSRPELPSNSIRFYARGGAEVDSVDVDVYKDGAWENVYEGAFSDKQLVEKSFSSGSVSQVRIRFHAANISQGFFYELYEVSLLKSSETTDESCLDLEPYLVPRYLTDIPYDPSQGNGEITYYAVKKTDNNRVIIYACNSELNSELKVIQ